MLTGPGDTICPCTGELLHVIKEKIQDRRGLGLYLTEIVVGAPKRASYPWFE